MRTATSEHELELAAIRKEFAGGLRGRVAALSEALSALPGGAPDALESFLAGAHRLKGTAASFGAAEVAGWAGALEHRARAWVREGIDAEEFLGALAELTRLTHAATAYEDAARRAGTSHAERRLAAAHARLEVVGELASLINETFDIGEIFRAAIPRLQRVLDFRRASVALRAPDGRHYRLQLLYDDARGGFLQGDPRAFPLRSGFPGRAMETGEPMRVDEFSGTEGIRLEDEGPISALIVPLRLDEQVIGTLNLGARESARYDDDDLSLATLLGRQLETSLRYSKLLATIQDQSTALAREHARLAALIEAAGSAIFMTTEGRIVYANQAMAELVGLPWEVLAAGSLEQVERSLTRALRDPAALDAQRAALAREGMTLNDEVEFVFPQPMVCRRLVDAVRGSRGELLGHLVVYRDVTGEVRAQAAKDEFVSLVSHELRTPLASIKTSLGLLNRGVGGPVTGPMREFVEIALRSLDRLIKLVDDMLDVSRIESGRLLIEPRPVRIAPIIAAAQDSVRGFAQERGVRLTQALGPEDTVVMGDGDRLEQVLVNLLSNAIKFSPPHSTVTVRTWHEPPAAVLAVEDEGPGIPPDQLAAIFDKFRQLDFSTARQYGGAGLGLYISRAIVERLGGQIWAASEEGRGARLAIRLPLAQAHERPTRRPGPRGPRPERLLLVERDTDYRRLLEVELGNLYPSVTAATLGADGLAAADTVRPDTIIVGYELKDMHGLEFIRRLQRSPVTADIPTLMVGGAGPPLQALGYGADGWAPAEVSAVLEEIDRVAALPRRQRVLLMEDDPSVRDVLGRLLRQAGFACLEAADGEVGLALASRRPPDVAIIDMQMPGLDGLAVLRAMRRNPALARTPTILASADDHAQDRARAMGAEFVLKPIDGPELLQALERALGGGALSPTP